MILMEERRFYPLKLPVDQRMKGPACCLALTCPRLIQGVPFTLLRFFFQRTPAPQMDPMQTRPPAEAR